MRGQSRLLRRGQLRGGGRAQIHCPRGAARRLRVGREGAAPRALARSPTATAHAPSAPGLHPAPLRPPLLRATETRARRARAGAWAGIRRTSTRTAWWSTSWRRSSTRGTTSRPARPSGCCPRCLTPSARQWFKGGHGFEHVGVVGGVRGFGPPADMHAAWRRRRARQGRRPSAPAALCEGAARAGASRR